MDKLNMNNNSFSHNIHNLIENGITIVMVFEKEWSGACQLLDPILKKLSDTFTGSIKMIRVNMEKDTELASQYGVYQAPSILLIKEGIIQETISGVMPYDLLKNKIKTLLS